MFANITEGDIVFQREPHTYLIKGKRVRSVTQVIEDAGMGEDFSLVPAAIMKVAQSRGIAVHQACALVDEGDLDHNSVDRRIKGYVAAYIRFRATSPIRTIQVETRMGAMIMGYGDRPVLTLVAGTPDWVCWFQGKRCIIDLKTCQTMGKAGGLQTMGYKKIWEASHPNQLIHARYGLRLSREGNYKLFPHEDPDDDQAFMDILDYTGAQEKRDRWVEKYGISA